MVSIIFIAKESAYFISTLIKIGIIVRKLRNSTEFKIVIVRVVIEMMMVLEFGVCFLVGSKFVISVVTFVSFRSMTVTIAFIVVGGNSTFS